MSVIVEDEDLAFSRLLWFTLSAIPGWMLAGMLLRYFPIFATDVLLLAPALLGTVLLVARLFDGVTDPLVAWLGDRRPQPRRRPYFLWGTLGIFAFAGLWLVPEALGGLALAAWLLAFFLLWETGQTFRGVSIGALGFEVAKTARRRTMFMVVSGIAALVGNVIGIFAMQYLLDHPDPRSAIPMVVIPMVAAFFLSAVLLGWRLREVPMIQRTEERPPIHMFREVLSNPYHRQYIGIQMAETFAFVSVGFSVPFIMQYLLGRPDLTMYIFLTNLVVGVLAAFAWWQVIGRIGTRRTWLAGQWVWVLTLGMWPLVLVYGLPAFFALAFLSGIANSAGNCVGYAMLGDIADYDARMSGRQRQGVYSTIYGLIAKVAAALTAFLLGWMLQFAGYVPNQEQGSGFTVAITLAISVLPVLCIFASIRLLSRYQLYEDEGIDDGRKPGGATRTLQAA